MIETEYAPSVKSWEHQYLNLLTDILQNGDTRIDRTGVGTIAVFGRTLDINLKDGFPAITTKKLAWKAVTSELLWFIEGSSDERRLAEILHGTRDILKKTIWTDNANASYWKPKAKFEGDLGSVYGVQWRSWRTSKNISKLDKNGDTWHLPEEIDQVKELINKIKNNPTDRRMIISAYNVGELDQMALPPCHMFAQFFVAKGELSCSMTMRSNDAILGLPFNIASYALLTHMLAQVTDLSVGRLFINLGDVHIYKNHIDAAKEQITRVILPPPKLLINESISDIDNFSMNDFELSDYQHHAAINLKMAV